MDNLTLMCQLYAKGNESVGRLKKLGLTNTTALASVSPKKLSHSLGISETMAERMIAYSTRLSAPTPRKSAPTSLNTKTKSFKKSQPFVSKPIATRIDADELDSLAGTPKWTTPHKEIRKTPAHKTTTGTPFIGEAQRYTMGWMKDSQVVVSKLFHACFFWKPAVDSFITSCKNFISRVIPNIW